MTLDEAIKHCEDVAEDKAGCCEDCIEEHRQLAEWLKELKQLRKHTEYSIADNTLTVTVDDATKISRVLVQDDKHNGGLFYADSD